MIIFNSKEGILLENGRKTYVCECGKVFNNPQAFNGHKSNCKIHLGDEKYQIAMDKLESMRIKGAQSIKGKSEKFHSQKDLELRQWIDEQHRCECCGIIMVERYGSGRFCSKSCASSRNHTEESRLKTSMSLMQFYSNARENGKSTQNLDFSKYVDGTKELYLQKVVTYKNLKYYTLDKADGIDFVTCPYCGVRMAELQSAHLKRHNKTKNDVLNEFGKDYQMSSKNTKDKRSESSKKTQKQLIEDGRHTGWQSRSIRSYAEEFWEKVLDNNGIKYDAEHTIKKKDLGVDDSSCYFLDFLIDGFIDLEIDGKQHTYEDRKEHDIERDKVLSKNGFLIYRIPWVNPNNDEGKKKVKEQIDTFISWYSNINNDMVLNI